MIFSTFYIFQRMLSKKTTKGFAWLLMYRSGLNNILTFFLNNDLLNQRYHKNMLDPCIPWMFVSKELHVWTNVKCPGSWCVLQTWALKPLSKHNFWSRRSYWPFLIPTFAFLLSLSFLLRSLLFTHFRDTQEADFLWTFIFWYT